MNWVLECGLFLGQHRICSGSLGSLQLKQQCEAVKLWQKLAHEERSEQGSSGLSCLSKDNAGRKGDPFDGLYITACHAGCCGGAWLDQIV